MDKDIKDYRKEELKNYVIGNIILILFFSGLLDRIIVITEDYVTCNAFNAVLSSALFSSVLYIYIFLADSLIPGEWKDKLIYSFTGKPSERIFSEIRDRNRDSRFETKQAIELYSDIYNRIGVLDVDDKAKHGLENSAWYRLYKKYESHAQIYVSHRDYLLCRDMTSMTVFIAVGYLFLQWYRGLQAEWNMLIVLLIEFVLTWWAAYYKSKRFTYNVIAIDIANVEKINRYR